MHFPRIAFFLAVLFALLTLSAHGAPAGPFIQPKDKAGALVHRYSGFAFPARMGRFHRVMPLQYDAMGRDVSVGYNLDLPPTAVTIYVYPTGQASLEQEFARLQREITGMHANARLVSKGITTVSPAKIRALSADYAYTERFAGAVQLVRSTLLVARRGQLFVEYRISHSAESAPVAGRLARQLTQEFAWP